MSRVCPMSHCHVLRVTYAETIRSWATQRRQRSSPTSPSLTLLTNIYITVIIAMSGGVDSSVTAALLARQDKFDLEGVFMRNWDAADDESLGGGCQWKKDWEDVQSVCKTLGIRARMVDLSKEYWTRVFEPSLRAWEKGWTPNPDVWCNKSVHPLSLPLLLSVFNFIPWGLISTGHIFQGSEIWSPPRSTHSCSSWGPFTVVGYWWALLLPRT